MVAELAMGFVIDAKSALPLPPPPPGSEPPRRSAWANPFDEPHPGLLTETEGDRKRWLLAASQDLKARFEKAKLRVGEDEARQLFVRATKRGHGKHGTRRKGLSPTRDADLLWYHDEAARGLQTEREQSTIPRLLAAAVYDEGRGKRYGASAGAIERHLRKLLAARKRHAEASAEAFRQWWNAYKAATGREPELGLLSAEPETK